MILPMIGQTGSFQRPSADLGDVQDLYLHGYVSSRIMRLSRESSDGGGEEKGLPITVAASHVDGLVLALTPNAHSYVGLPISCMLSKLIRRVQNYRSAVLFGHASLVTDVDEKLFAMELITNSVVPQRWPNTRVPPNGAEMSSTSVLKVTIANGSAKIRQGLPHDEKYDIQDENVLDRVWTGVVPVYPTLGELVPGPYNRVERPGYLTEFQKDFNDAAREQSMAATVEPTQDKTKS